MASRGFSSCFQRVLAVVHILVLYRSIGSFSEIVESASCLSEEAVVPTFPIRGQRPLRPCPFREEVPLQHSVKSEVSVPAGREELSTTLSGSPSKVTKRMIVEHVLLFKFKEGYTQEVEDNMFEDLWTFEDYFPTVMSMSMGRVLAKDPHGVTHGLVMRLPSKEALDTYVNDDYRIRVAHHVVKYAPFFEEEFIVDYEAEVDSDESKLYTDSEKFSDGVEHVDLFKFKEGTSAYEIEEIMNLATDLPNKMKTSFGEFTSGTNYKPNERYTHGVTIRLPSAEGLEGSLTKDPAYLDMMKKAESILEDSISVDFFVSGSKKRGHLATV